MFSPAVGKPSNLGYEIMPFTYYTVDPTTGKTRKIKRTHVIYRHYVRFVDAPSAAYVASTVGSVTTINSSGLKKFLAGHKGTPDMGLIYSNILIHEVLWLGVLGPGLSS